MAKKPRSIGRPRVLDEAKKAVIIHEIEVGLSRSSCAAIVGVATSTIANEAARDPEFLAALRKAEGKCESYHILRIRGGVQAWQSSAWFLERKWPKRWAKREAMPPKPAQEDTEAIRIRAVVRTEVKTPIATPRTD